MSDGDSGPPTERDSEGPEPPTEDSDTQPDDESTEPLETSPPGPVDDMTPEERGDVPPGASSDSDGESMEHEATGTPEQNQVTIPEGEPVEAAPPGAESTPPSSAAGPEPLDAPTAPAGEPGDPPGGDPGGEPMGTPGAPDDEEMPLTQHIEEMVHRLGIVVLVMAVVAAVAFPFADRLINFLWFSLLPGTVAQCPPQAGASVTPPCPRVYHPLALMLARLKVATLAGFIVGLPVFVYETYLFMRPGLFPRERRYYLSAVPTSVVLAAIGVAFAFLVVLPAIFTYFLYYTQGAADIAFGLSDTFNLMVMMLGMFAFIFQIPLFVMLAIMMGITTRRWLESRRIYFWGGFLTIAFFFSPDPTGMAPIIVGITMVTLFEGTLALLRWTGAGSMAPGVNEIAGLRPLIWTLVAVLGYLASPAPMPTGYYSAFPPVVTNVLSALGLTRSTPIIVGGGLIAIFEGLNYLLRKYRAPYRLRRVLGRLRVPVWLSAVVVGYLASPNPQLLAKIDRTVLTTQQTLLIAGGLIILYEGALVVWRWRTRRSQP